MHACFIGHRTVEKKEELISSLNETIIALIKNGVTTFYFGSMSEFDNLCWEIVTQLKEKYPQLRRIYVRAEFSYIDVDYKKYLLEY